MTAPHLCGSQTPTGRIRVRPEDFRVNEVLSFAADGSGQHLLVQIEKTAANTAWVANQLAAYVGAGTRDVAYAGRKDRHAVTRQWFSIDLQGRPDPDWSCFRAEGVRILKSIRHSRKLRRGAIAANEFTIIVRDFDDPADAVPPALARVSKQGFPNFFGTQRFGNAGSNIDLAARWFSGAIRLRGDKRSMALSAARSLIFNAVLDKRVQNDSWLTCQDGEALNPEGRGGFFLCDSPDEDIRTRIANGQLHLTGPLWGSGPFLTGATIADFEAGVAGQFANLRDGLEGSRMRHQRRALRAMPRELCWEQRDNTLHLSFALGSGVYATSLLSAILNTDETRAQR